MSSSRQPRQPLQPSNKPNLPPSSSTTSTGALPSSSSIKPNTPPPKSHAPPPTPPQNKPGAPTSTSKPGAPPNTSLEKPNTPPSTPPHKLPSQAQPNPSSAESPDLDPATAAQGKQSDLVYDQVLRHLDWDGKKPNPPPKPFKAFYFLQPASAQQQFHATGVGAPAAGQYWKDDGTLAPATAVMIPSEAQNNDLRAWAKKQGRSGRLCPDVFLVGGKKVNGQVLVVSS